jgi:DUF1680 family protein
VTVSAQRSDPVAVRHSAHARLQPLALGDAAIVGGLWAGRKEVNREVLLPEAVGHLEAAGNLDNLRAAAGHATTPFRGMVFADSDVYKWLEAVGWELARTPDDELARAADAVIELVAAAQDDDGYLNSYYQVAQPGERWSNLAHDHELYCAGHLIQAAVAQHRGRGDDRLLQVALRLVDLIESVFDGGRQPATPGHPEIETALVELYRLTRDPRHLGLARYFVDQRGHGQLGPGRFGSSYFQDHVPVREATVVTGHAVRALYLAAGVTDIYLETGEIELLSAMLAQWHDMTARKSYVTGGLGAHHQDEAFGDPYELPPDRCYGETCAAIASIMWNWRMLLVTGDARHADLIERTLYNAFLVGLALDGRGFSYVNPLQVRDQHRDPVERGALRQPWYECACCPPNVMRLLATLDDYLATTDGHGLAIHQYAPARLATEQAAAGPIELTISTEYPWQGRVELELTAAPAQPWTLGLRIPAWASTAGLAVNDEPVEVQPGCGYARLLRTWRAGDRVVLDLPMAPRLVAPHPRIDAVRGCLAIERGPLVYCIEQADQPDTVTLDDLRLDPAAPLVQRGMPGLPANTVALSVGGRHAPARDPESWGYAPVGEPMVDDDVQSVDLTAIPYAFWGNRADGAMRVWIPVSG